MQAVMMGQADGVPIRDDKVTVTMAFEDGSFGTVHYLANGHKGFPKERLEVFCAGRILQLDNFRRLRAYGWPGFRKMNLWRQDKGNASCVAAFVDAIEKGGPPPIPFEQLVEVTRATFDIVDLLE
jgi:predicted dehydrogenase